MANIADNLKRLLGTEGHNIQEVLENADSIGGGSIPYIKFVETEDPEDPENTIFVVGGTRGITDATEYTGPCYVDIVSSTISNEFGTPSEFVMLGSAIVQQESVRLEDGEPLYSTAYSIGLVHPVDVTFLIFTVESAVTEQGVELLALFNTFTLSKHATGTLTPANPGHISDGGNS